MQRIKVRQLHLRCFAKFARLTVFCVLVHLVLTSRYRILRWLLSMQQQQQQQRQQQQQQQRRRRHSRCRRLSLASRRSPSRIASERATYGVGVGYTELEVFVSASVRTTQFERDVVVVGTDRFRGFLPRCTSSDQWRNWARDSDQLIAPTASDRRRRRQ